MHAQGLFMQAWPYSFQNLATTWSMGRGSAGQPAQVLLDLFYNPQYLPLVMGLRQEGKGEKTESIIHGGPHMPPPYPGRKLKSGDFSPASKPRDTGAAGRRVRERK